MSKVKQEPKPLPITKHTSPDGNVPHSTRKLSVENRAFSSVTHLGLALEVESEDVFAPPCLTLTYQENTMGVGASSQY